MQLGVCRLDSRSSVAQKEKTGERGGKSIEKKIWSQPDGRDMNLLQRLRLISQGEIPLKNRAAVFEIRRRPDRRPLTHKYE